MVFRKVEHMNFKLIGAILIIAGSGSFGFLISLSHKRTVRIMKEFMAAIEYIVCELRYRMPPLPDVLKQTAENSTGTIQKFFTILADELEGQVSPNVSCCVEAALTQIKDMPDIVRKGILLLGQTMGKFDIEGQLRGLNNVYQECSIMLTTFANNQEVRLRSYQTLALCAGAAVTILFI